MSPCQPPPPPPRRYVSMLSQGRLMGISTSQTGERPAYNDRELQKIISVLGENNADLITLS